MGASDVSVIQLRRPVAPAPQGRWSVDAVQELLDMPFKAPPDLSKFLLSPMPGLLVDIAVQPGQKVQAGEKLAVIEAMKMENILFAAQDGVVGKITAGKGESLSVDQIILEFV